MPNNNSQSNACAVADLLPIVYDELRRLAAAQMAHERDGHTLDGTALVHEAFLRLGGEQSFASKGAFLRAAAEAMRRILVDHARARQAEKRGGGLARVELPEAPALMPDDDLLALDEALCDLASHDPTAAELVKLRYFSGFSHGDAAEALGLTHARPRPLGARPRLALSTAPEQLTLFPFCSGNRRAEYAK